MKRLYFPAFWRNTRVLGSSLSSRMKEKRACCGEEQRQFQLWIDILLFLAILSNSSLKVQLVFGFPVLRHIHRWRDARLMASGDGQWWLGKVAGFWCCLLTCRQWREAQCCCCTSSNSLSSAVPLPGKLFPMFPTWMNHCDLVCVCWFCLPWIHPSSCLYHHLDFALESTPPSMWIYVRHALSIGLGGV